MVQLLCQAFLTAAYDLACAASRRDHPPAMPRA